jgi:hypothetical protein
MYHNICSYHNVYVFFFLLLSSLFCQPYTFLFFSSILPICCSHLWPPVFSTIVVYYLSSSLTKEVVSCWSLVRYIGSHCLAFDLQTPYGWCQTILNIFFVKLLLCKPTWIAHQIYLILSSPVASDFFVSITVVGLYVPESSISSS